MGWCHPEDRQTWSIGPFDFAASRHNSGWLFWAWIGHEEQLERYYECSLEEIKQFSVEWVRSLLKDFESECDQFEVTP